MVKKETAIAMTLSFIITGAGLIYLEDIKRGVGFLAAAIVLNVLGMWVSGIFSFISILVWIFSMYLTYMKLQERN